MNQDDRRRFTACLVAMSEIYGKEISQSVAQLWWVALQRFEMTAVEMAFQRHYTSPDVGQFMPKPADIIRMLEGTTLDASQVAWAKVDRAVRSIGTYATVVFDDALIHRVVTDMGGWIQLGTKKEADWPHVAREFTNRYAGYRGRDESPAYPPRLVGITEAENTRNGYTTPEAVLIGDVVKAKTVMAGGTDKPLFPAVRIPAIPLELPALKEPPLRLVKPKEDPAA